MKQADFTKLVEAILPKERMDQVQDKLLKWLAVNSPAMAEIFTLSKEIEVVDPNRSFLNKWNPFSSNQMVKVQSRAFNWEGLLLHGALMKGEAIHDIAKDCIVKFFVKKRLEMKNSLKVEGKDVDNFSFYLGECLEPALPTN